MKLNTSLGWWIDEVIKPTNHKQNCQCCGIPLKRGDIVYKMVCGFYDNHPRYTHYHPVCLAKTFLDNCEGYLNLSKKGKREMKKLLDEIMVEEL